VCKVAAEKPQVTITAAIGVHGKKSVENEVPQTFPSGFEDERTPTARTNYRMTTGRD
jgi:hypothetical protein